jgi:hypothetical protein
MESGSWRSMSTSGVGGGAIAGWEDGRVRCAHPPLTVEEVPWSRVSPSASAPSMTVMSTESELSAL